ncbi:fungal-specific transcription factor domain-containing protein [Flagelloscypha sp. PMI_526]|nr:fungal-specific transcription factor domain-containing protein [Flagelloscypha sp. PMI_526]
MSEPQPRQRRKPGRVPTSCAECRRLKLKCDRGIPCEKCVSRGCASICPDGTLATGRGNRLVLANTKELHDEIDTLRRRVRELEDGLRAMQESVSLNTHPLLSPELLQIKNGSSGNSSRQVPPVTGRAGSSPSRIEQGSSPASNGQSSSSSDPPPSPTAAEEHDFIDSFGTLSIGAHGEFTFLGKSARSEFLMRASQPPKKQPEPKYPRISDTISKSGCDNPDINPKMAAEIFSHLPLMSEAIFLSELYLENGRCHYVAIPREELFDELLTAAYRADSVEEFDSPQALSLLFAVFALGALYDPHREPFNVDSLEYLHLARTTYGLVQEQTTLISIQALSHMCAYLELSNAESNVSHTLWTWMGHSAQLAHSIGLHLDSARWKLDSNLAHRRSVTFWSMFVFDTWTSFLFGRPPSMSLAFVDCPFPVDYQTYEGPNGEREIGYHAWTFQFSKFMHGVMEAAFGTRIPTYHTILALDRQIRDFPVPPHLRPFNSETQLQDKDNKLFFQRWNALLTKENTLIQLHRGYFAQALQDSPNDLSSHRYLPSVMAVYRSAWRIAQGLRCSWTNIPEKLVRIPMTWSHALSAGIVMCLLATKAPKSNMGRPALDELNLLAGLFEEAAPTCRPAAHSLAAVQNLREHGVNAANQLNGGSPRLCTDELDRLGGKTKLVSTTAKVNQEMPGGPPAIVGSRDRSGQRKQNLEEWPPNRLLPPQDMQPALIQDFDMSLENLLPRRPASSTFNFDFRPPSSSNASSSTASFTDPALFQPSLFGISSSSTIDASGASPPLIHSDSGPAVPHAPAFLDATWERFVEQLGAPLVSRTTTMTGTDDYLGF